MLSFPAINYLAVLVSAALCMAIGMLWYSPALFGNKWLELTGNKEPDMKDAPKIYIGAILNALIVSTVLAVFIYWIGAVTPRDGALVGFLAWLGFIATSHFSGVLWEKKPLNLFFLHAANMLVTLVIIGALLAWWR